MALTACLTSIIAHPILARMEVAASMAPTHIAATAWQVSMELIVRTTLTTAPLTRARMAVAVSMLSAASPVAVPPSSQEPLVVSLLPVIAGTGCVRKTSTRTATTVPLTAAGSRPATQDAAASTTCVPRSVARMVSHARHMQDLGKRGNLV